MAGLWPHVRTVASFTNFSPFAQQKAQKRRVDVSFIALAFFAMIVFLGKTYGAWEGASGNVQLTLVICFLLGAVCGYKARG